MKDIFLKLTMYSALIGTSAGILALVLGILIAGADSQTIHPLEDNNHMIQPAEDPPSEELIEPVEYIELDPMYFNARPPSGM